MTVNLKVVASNGESVDREVKYEFPRGSVVHLKSASPLMTVQNPGKEWSECTWFDEIGNRIGPEPKSGVCISGAERQDVVTAHHRNDILKDSICSERGQKQDKRRRLFAA